MIESNLKRLRNPNVIFMICAGAVFVAFGIAMATPMVPTACLGCSRGIGVIAIVAGIVVAIRGFKYNPADDVPE